MKNLKNGLAWKICAVTGVCLIVAAMAWLVIWQSGIGSSVKQAEYYADTIRALIPEPQGAVLTERRDNNMSTLSIDDINFVGIIEMPRYESVLPVCADWATCLIILAVSAEVFMTVPCKSEGLLRRDSMIFTVIFLWEIPFSLRIWKETVMNTQ